MVRQLAGQQNAVAIEPPFAVGFVGEPELARVALVVLGRLAVDGLGGRRVFPAEMMTQACDRERDDVVVVRVIDKSVGDRFDEWFPVQLDAKCRKGGGVQGAIQQARGTQFVDGQQIVIGPPRFVCVFERQPGDFAEGGEVLAEARIVVRPRDQILGESDSDFSRQEFVVAVEDRGPVNFQIPFVAGEVVQ